MNSQEYIELSVRIDPFSEELAEILTSEIAELPFEAFSSEAPYLKCYIQKDLYKAQDVKVVLSGMTGLGAAISWEANLIQGRNWNREWESEFSPIVVDGTVTIKAPFNKDVPRTRFNIWIEPEMAFGTGSHHTTFMMMQQMLALENDIRDHVVLDMGCGTAILGILAAKMRASKVYAIDIDAVAARSAWGNARWNRVGSRIRTLCGDASLLQMGSYDIILANIHRNIIIEDLPTYVRSLRKGGRILLSGFFETDIPAVLDAAAPLGLSPFRTLTREGWACLGMERVGESEKNN